MTDKLQSQDWSSSALKVCLVCDYLWTMFVFSGCAYVVFWLGFSGWWFALACVLSTTSCRSFRSPAQIREDVETEEKT